MADSRDERRQEFDNPSFNTGFMSYRWFDEGKQDLYEKCLELAWKTLLAEDDWYRLAAGARRSDAPHGQRGVVRGRAEVRTAEGAGKGSGHVRAPEVFGREASAIDLMRAVIVLFYGKAADVLGIERPPDFGLRADVLKR